MKTLIILLLLSNTGAVSEEPNTTILDGGVIELSTDYVPESIEYCAEVVLGGMPNRLKADCSYIINN